MALDFLTRGLDESHRIAGIRRSFRTVKKRQKKNIRGEHSKSNAFLESHLKLVKAAARYEIFSLLSKVFRHMAK